MTDISTTPLIQVDRVERTYPDGDVRALRGVSLHVMPGESVAITGPSGCGKSTLLHILGSLDLPTSGTVAFNGKDLRTLDHDDYRARQIGFVFQSFYLLPTLSALETVQVPMFEAELASGDRGARAESLLEEVGMSHRAGQYPSRLSVGERQRIAIARALANSPKALLADEPTGNLDSKTQDEVLILLDRLRRERGLTLLMVTHSSDVAKACDRVIKMRDGLIIES